MISIIVPVYNTEKYLPSCLDSLINQNVEKEIIIIDDGSTDNSFRIMKEYAKKYSFIKIFHQINKGQSAARNVGIKEAKGDYLFFCDSDDYIDNNSLRKLEIICDDKNLDLLKTGWKTFDINKNMYYNRPDKRLSLYLVMNTQDYFHQSIKYWYNVIPFNGIIKRKYIIDNNIFFPEGIQFEDNYFHLLLMLKDLKARVLQIDNYFYNVRISSNSTTTSIPSPKKIYDQLTNIKLMSLFINGNISNKKVKKDGFRAISSLVFTLTSYYYRLDDIYKKKVYKTISRKLLRKSIIYSVNLFQKTKIFAFTYCRLLLDIYERIKKHVKG